MPFMQDVVAHIFFYTKHIASVHKENGRFHVHFEVKESSSKEKNKENQVPSTQKNNPANEYAVMAEKNQMGDWENERLNYLPLSNYLLPDGTLKLADPPPRRC